VGRDYLLTQLTIKGQGPFDFMVDSGLTAELITPHLQQALGIKGGNTRISGLVGAGRRARAGGRGLVGFEAYVCGAWMVICKGGVKYGWGKVSINKKSGNLYSLPSDQQNETATKLRLRIIPLTVSCARRRRRRRRCGLGPLPCRARAARCRPASWLNWRALPCAAATFPTRAAAACRCRRSTRW
jgi:hypothetical protein